MWSKSLEGNEPIVLSAEEWDATEWAFPCETDIPEGMKHDSFLRFDASGMTIDLQHGSVKGAQITDMLTVCYLFLTKVNEKSPHIHYQVAANHIMCCLDQLRLKRV
jgi:hypothetical protein